MAVAAGKRRYEGCDGRLYLLSVGLVAVFSVLGVRLWYLQIVHGEYYRTRAEAQRLYPQRLQAPRGLIKATDGTVMADTRPAFDLFIVPKECPEAERPAVCERLEELLAVDGKALLKQIEASSRHPFTQVLVKEDVPKSTLALVEENSPRLPGVLSVVRPQRRYSGKVASQLLGYLTEVDAELLAKDKARAEKEGTPPKYRMGDVVGRGGLEAKYDERLRGEDGRMVVSVYSSRGPQLRTDQFGNPQILFDSLGRKLEEEKGLREDPVAGRTLNLTLDLGLQAKCEEILEKQISTVVEADGSVTLEPCRGAIAVLDANTGAVLALASAPRFDPGAFVTSGAIKERLDALEVVRTPEGKLKAVPKEERRFPTWNRNYQFVYPPGSTFKVMMACAALEEGTIEGHTTFGCGGYFSRPGLGRTWRCWTYNRGGHGGVDVVEALSRSCDVYFYQVGLNLGPKKLKEWSDRMGFGHRTGVDISGEATGHIDDPEAFQASMKEKYPKEPHKWKWYPWQTVNMSIGQSITVTPLQNAVMMACVVNGGRRVRPYLNKELGPDVSEPFLSEETLRLVQQGMRQCVEDDVYPRGTGIEARVPGLIVIGKTGSAQVRSVNVTDKYGKNETRIPYRYRDHALFVCGVLHPERPIAISVIFEHGLHGSSAASPLAREVIEYFYGVEPKPPKDTKVAKAD